MYEPHTENARNAGKSWNFDEWKSPCLTCLDQASDACELCRDDPEPDPEHEITRLCVFCLRNIKAIANADLTRLEAGAAINSPTFQAQITQPLNDLNGDIERLFALLDMPAEEKK